MANLAINLIRLARPAQWVKGVFVLLGPLYGFADKQPINFWSVAACFMAFAFASSGCYVINDLRDVEADKVHPRKKKRPLASGEVSVGVARVWAIALLAAAWLCTFIPVVIDGAVQNHMMWTAALVAVYVLNTILYSLRLKHLVIVDVLSLSLGFVLRVLGGCAAAGVEPTTWLLNCTFFVSMFLAFGKRLGELRSLGEAAGAARGVLRIYTIDLLKMAMVVTAVAALVTYAGYAQAKADRYTMHYAGWGFNVLWLTMLPATYALMRSIVQMERGRYDDPTELAYKDGGFRAAVVVFGLLTVGAMLLVK